MTSSRIFPMAKPAGFTPAVQRYSARVDADVAEVEVLLLGVQSAQSDDPAIDSFQIAVVGLFAGTDGPDHFDFSQHIDDAGYTNYLAVAYWSNSATYRRWWQSAPVADWWNDPAKQTGSAGYFVEPLSVKADALETIAFRQYIRGLSACPMSTVEPMGESGYWGAARDRIPRSASDRFDTPEESPMAERQAATLGKRVVVEPPVNYCVIRSGVSWAECGPAQLDSYRSNVEPKLNAGMDYLRAQPLDSRCWSVRQVRIVDTNGHLQPESYVAAHFVSLADLERWAHHHPTHLAIFGQAQKERVKYQDDLELRTYHEVYIVEKPEDFEYVNCHRLTGALGLLEAVQAETTQR